MMYTLTRISAYMLACPNYAQGHFRPYVELGNWFTTDGRRSWDIYSHLRRSVFPHHHRQFPHPLVRRSTLMGAWKKNRKRGCV